MGGRSRPRPLWYTSLARATIPTVLRRFATIMAVLSHSLTILPLALADWVEDIPQARVCIYQRQNGVVARLDVFGTRDEIRSIAQI